MTRPPVAKSFRLLSLALLAAAVPTVAAAGAVTQLTSNTAEDLNTDAAVDVAGNVHVVYERAGNIYYRGRTGTAWSAEELVAAGSNPAVGAGGSGVPQVVFVSGPAVAFTARVGGTWTAPVPIGDGYWPDLAVDGNDVAHVVFVGNTDTTGGSANYADLNYTNDAGGAFPPSPLRIWSSWYWYESGGRTGRYHHEVPPVVAVDAAGHVGIAHVFHYVDGGMGWTEWGTNLQVYRSVNDTELTSPEWYKSWPPAPQRNGLALADDGTAYLAYGASMATVAAAWTSSALPAGSSHTLDTSPAPALHLAFIDPAGTPEYAVDTGGGFGTPVVVGPTTFGRNPIAIAQTDPFVVYEASDGGDYEVWFARTTNQAPVFDAIGDKTVNEGETLSFTAHATDADGDTLQYGGSGMPMNTTLDSDTGAFTFSPDFTQAGSYSATFQVSDGADTDEETITITVNQVNAPPVLGAVGDKSVDENAALEFTLSATDVDADELTFSATNLPTGATLDPLTGAFSWTPTYDQAGTYSGVVFTVTDGATPGLSDSETVTLTVNDVNRDPVLAPVGDRSIDEGATLSFTVSGTDDDGDALTYGASNLPSGASFEPATRTFTWTPDYEQSGTYAAIQFTVTDDGTPPLGASESITVTVNDVNAPPVLAVIGDRSVSEAATLSFTVSATDVDKSDTLTYSASGLPAGAAFDPGTATFSWTPGYDQGGSHAGVVFTVTDDGSPARSDSETITITVDNVNRAPVLDPVGDKSVTEGRSLSFTVSATDEDGETLTYGASNLPAGATFDPATRTFSWRPGYDQGGDHAGVVFTVADAEASDSESITITVTDDPTPPGFFTVTPCRLIDTRAAAGDYGGPALAPGAERTFDVVAGACGIPASARAISVNVTVTQPAAAGNLRLYPAGVAVPTASTINYSSGQTRANNAIVRLSELGELAVRCFQASGTAHFILDVNGYFQEEVVEQ